MNGQRTTTAVDGFLLLNKPAGITSNRALQKVKRLLGARKAGHSGSLDPAATGMLPLCFGEATKVCAYLLDADKTYRVVARIGEATDTGDADGEVNATATVPEMTPGDWEKVMHGFIGNTQQVPPMFSALKKDGVRLYELARKGQIVERQPRPVRLDQIDLIESHGARLVFRVCCSKGTYVRTLVEDIAKAAGTVAHTAKLHRESLGSFRAEQMLDLASAEKFAAAGPEALRKQLLPVDQALLTWPDCRIAAADISRFSGGQTVVAPAGGTGLVRVYGATGDFLGMGELSCDGTVAPKRIFRLGG
jgi:tRNA pseudouridine55 synthase